MSESHVTFEKKNGGYTSVVLPRTLDGIESISLSDRSLNDATRKNFRTLFKEHMDPDILKNMEPDNFADIIVSASKRTNKNPAELENPVTTVDLSIKFTKDEKGTQLLRDLWPLRSTHTLRGTEMEQLILEVQDRGGHRIKVPYHFIDQALDKIGLSKEERDEVMGKVNSIMGR